MVLLKGNGQYAYCNIGGASFEGLLKFSVGYR